MQESPSVMRNIIQTYRLPIIISIYFLLLAWFYASSTAPFEAPDEGAHLSYVHHLLTTGTLPVLEDHETMWTVNAGQLAGHHPPLYYFLASIPIQFVDISALPDYFLQNPFGVVGQFSYNNQNAYLHPLSVPDDTLLAVYIARALSSLLTLITLWLVYQTAYLLSDNRLFAAMTMLFAASIPTFVFIGSSINNDNLATLIFAAGTLYIVRIWKMGGFYKYDWLILGILLSGAALTKLNTLFIFVVIYSVFLVGALTGRFTWREVITTGFIAGMMSLTLAGWYFWRNFQVYNDPFALDATIEVWGRGGSPDTLQDILSESRGIWESFWYTLGNLNIRAADWVYQYINIISLLGVSGFITQIVSNRQKRPTLLLLLFVVAIAVIALILATRQINVSQGRILFPSIAAFTTLLMSGWSLWLGKRFFWLPIVPLVFLTALAPFTQLQPTYRFPEVTTRIPDDAIPLDVSADGIELLGYRYEPEQISGQETVTVNLWIRGTHPDDPSLFIKLIDPVSNVPVGGVDTYPNMTLLSSLEPDTIYRIQTTFAVDDALITGFFSRELRLRVGWRLFDRDNPEDETFLLWENSAGVEFDTVLLDAPAFINPDFEPEPLANPVENIQFGENIRLTAYQFSETTVTAGSEITITTNWEALGTSIDSWIITVGVLNQDGELVAQADAPPSFFPTDQWRKGYEHQDTRILTLPDDLAESTYQTYLAFYRTPDYTRLPISGDVNNATDRTYPLGEITVEALVN